MVEILEFGWILKFGMVWYGWQRLCNECRKRLCDKCWKRLCNPEQSVSEWVSDEGRYRAARAAKKQKHLILWIQIVSPPKNFLSYPPSLPKLNGKCWPQISYKIWYKYYWGPGPSNIIFVKIQSGSISWYKLDVIFSSSDNFDWETEENYFYFNKEGFL